MCPLPSRLADAWRDDLGVPEPPGTIAQAFETSRVIRTRAGMDMPSSRLHQPRRGLGLRLRLGRRLPHGRNLLARAWPSTRAAGGITPPAPPPVLARVVAPGGPTQALRRLRACRLLSCIWGLRSTLTLVVADRPVPHHVGGGSSHPAGPARLGQLYSCAKQKSTNRVGYRARLVVAVKH